MSHVKEVGTSPNLLEQLRARNSRYLDELRSLMHGQKTVKVQAGEGQLVLVFPGSKRESSRESVQVKYIRPGFAEERCLIKDFGLSNCRLEGSIVGFTTLSGLHVDFRPETPFELDAEKLGFPPEFCDLAGEIVGLVEKQFERTERKDVND